MAKLIVPKSADYKRQVEQVKEARELNKGIDENNKLARIAIWVAVAGTIFQFLQLFIH